MEQQTGLIRRIQGEIESCEQSNQSMIRGETSLSDETIGAFFKLNEGMIQMGNLCLKWVEELEKDLKEWANFGKPVGMDMMISVGELNKFIEKALHGELKA